MLGLAATSSGAYGELTAPSNGQLTAELYAAGVTAPAGQVWIGTHLWLSDQKRGFCRLDDREADGTHRIDASTCLTSASSPGQPTYDRPAPGARDGRHLVYVPDAASPGRGVVRLELDPAGQTIVDAVTTGRGTALARLGATASALGPDGNLYVATLESGLIVRVTNPRSLPRHQGAADRACRRGGRGLRRRRLRRAPL